MAPPVRLRRSSFDTRRRGCENHLRLPSVARV
jgi:hypothetical protein